MNFSEVVEHATEKTKVLQSRKQVLKPTDSSFCTVQTYKLELIGDASERIPSI